MKLDLLFRPQAEADISKAYEWYEKQLDGLGDGFVSSIDTILHSIQVNPSKFKKVHKNIRRALLRCWIEWSCKTTFWPTEDFKYAF